MDSIHELMQSVETHIKTPIVRIPCLAHVIQLSLKDLLGLIKWTQRMTLQIGSGLRHRPNLFAPTSGSEE